MHICFLTHEYPKPGYSHGGVGSFVKMLAPALAALGHRVSVVGQSYDSKDEITFEQGVAIYRYAKKKKPLITWLLAARAQNKLLAKIHNEHQIDIVEGSELSLAFVSKISKIRYIIRLHGGHHFFAEAENRGINRWKGFQEKRSFSRADAFIAVSHYVKTHTEKFLSYHQKPVAFISNPIDLNLFHPRPQQLRSSKIVFAGTVCEKKGVRQLIQAFPIVKSKFPRATLELFGRDWFYSDGRSYTSEMIALIDSTMPQYKDAITFHGAVPQADLPQVFASGSVCVFPSHMETQGLVAPEAMAMEQAVVFTELGPGPEIIDDFKTGLLCDPHNPEDIADKILWVLSQPEKALALGKAARQAAIKNYDVNYIVQRNVEFYHSVLDAY